MAGGWILDFKSKKILQNGFLLAGGLVLGVILGLVIVLMGSSRLAMPNQIPPPMIGNLLKSFSLQDLEGDTFTLEDHYGTPMVINFWATWCKPCENEMPLLNKIATEYSEEILVVGVDVEEDLATITNFVTSHQIEFTILTDTNGTIADQYLVNGFPTTFFVDKSGVLQAIRIGELDEAMLWDYLEKVEVLP